MLIISKLVQRKQIIKSFADDGGEQKQDGSKQGARISRTVIVPSQLAGLTELEAHALKLTWKRLNGLFSVWYICLNKQSMYIENSNFPFDSFLKN